MMVEIKKDACIGCGLCVEDCIVRNIKVEDEKASVLGDCFLCGHCVAVCPQGAVAIPEYDMADVEDCTPDNAVLDSETLLRAIKFRRSVRDYKKAPIEPEVLSKVLEAGRYTATAKNTQGCRFIVVQRELDTFKKLIWDELTEALTHPSDPDNQWAEAYRHFYESRLANPDYDYLFRNAPAVLFIAADIPIDGGLAAQNIELAAVSLGLGMLYNGYLIRVANRSPKIRAWLGAADKPLQACALIGTPAVSYKRNAPRRIGDYVIK